MAAIEELIAKSNSSAKSASILKNDSVALHRLFDPVIEAGFTDFNWAGEGTSSFFVAPVDNPSIVFRVTSESELRTNKNPFFLCSAYEDEIYHPPSNENLRLEVLLTGRKDVPESEKVFLTDEMKQAGWALEKIEKNKLSRFWKDVVAVSVRDNSGRMRSIPIISDPSAFFNYLEHAKPSYQHFGDGTCKAPNLNRCSSGYITLQDQAAAYNNIISQDTRLLRLIPQPIAFPETEIIPVKTLPRSQSHG